MRVLVLGGYGLIGAGVVRACLARGWAVTGAGRSPGRGQRLIPAADWRRCDLAAMTASEDWAEWLGGHDAVINAAGALQDGAGDDLGGVHEAGVAALAAACGRAGVKHLVQISAPGAVADAPTAFLRTKAAGDAAVRGSGVHFTILKPALVIGPEASGGSGLLRGLAALPFVQPLAHADSPVQTVSLDELAEEAADCAAGLRPPGFEAVLAEGAPQTLADIVTEFRAWLGFPPARIVAMPGWTAALAGMGGDIAAALGWRTPLRSTAMRSMAAGVAGDPGVWRAARGREALSLTETLSRLPATAQERRFARLYFLHPLVLITLAAFWIASGFVGIFWREDAAAILTGAGFGAGFGADFAPQMAMTAVLGGAGADIALGALALWRRTSRAALWGMIALTAGYLLAAALFVPNLWADPLGPMIKSIPAALLAALALALHGEAR